MQAPIMRAPIGPIAVRLLAIVLPVLLPVLAAAPMAARAADAAPVPSVEPGRPLDRLAVESLLIENGFTFAAIDQDRGAWRGEGLRDGRLIRFTVQRRGIEITASTPWGGGPIADHE